MKKTVMMAAAAALAMAGLGGTAHASEVTVEGNVTLLCDINTTSVTIALGDLVDSTGAADSAEDDVDLNVFCNGVNSTLDIDSDGNGLTSIFPGTAPAGFDARANYEVSVAWGSVTVEGETTGDPNSGTPLAADLNATDPTVGALSGAATVTVTTIEGQPLLAGDYTDTITLTVAGVV